MDLKKVLKDFMLTPAPSGYESKMAYSLKNKLENYCDEVSIDKIGNCIGKINGTQTDPLSTMVFAHMDQLGFIVRKVDDNGYIQVDRLGGITEKVLPGLELLIRDEEGSWHPGVFGVKAHHAMSEEEKHRVDPVTSMLIDIGAGSKEEVEHLGIYAGCPVVYKPSFKELAGSKISGTSVDDRGGCAALVNIASRLSINKPKCDVFIVGTFWEEFNLRGAMIAARRIDPDIAISLDVTLAGDTKDLSTRFDTELGKGPCIQLYSFHGRGTLNGTIANEPLFKIAKKAAFENDLPFQRFSALGLLTDIKAGSDGLVVLPYFSGERTPINDPKAKGMIFGLNLLHTREHIYNACLESIGYGIAQHFDIFKERNMDTQKVMAVGGGTKTPKWLQMVSDICSQTQYVTKTNIGAAFGDAMLAAFGDAMLAALGVGFYKNSQEISKLIQTKSSIIPDPEQTSIYRPIRKIYSQLYQVTKDIMHSY